MVPRHPQIGGAGRCAVEGFLRNSTYIHFGRPQTRLKNGSQVSPPSFSEGVAQHIDVGGRRGEDHDGDPHLR
jgi:hypothetical protein